MESLAEIHHHNNRHGRGESMMMNPIELATGKKNRNSFERDLSVYTLGGQPQR
jgi:hypothetical protein